MRLYELRREPSINTKQSTVDSLLKYANNPKTAVSFSPIQKIGINPQSDWDTPNGVYAYQINQYKSALQGKDNIEGVFPFGSERPYVFVLDSRASNPLDFDKNIPDADFDKYIQFIKNHFKVDDEAIGTFLTPRMKSRFPTNSQQLYYIVRRLLLNEGGGTVTTGMTNKFNKILRTFGFDAVVDNGHGVLHSGMEPIQVVYLTPSAYAIKDVFQNDAMHREDRKHAYGHNYRHPAGKRL
jgi:hypothetical protein